MKQFLADELRELAIVKQMLLEAGKECVDDVAEALKVIAEEELYINHVLLHLLDSEEKK